MSGTFYENYKVTTVLVPAVYDSDTALAGSDNTNAVDIEGLRGVFFGVLAGDVTATASLGFQIGYASDGVASNASTSTTVWASSDAIVTLDSDNLNSVVGLYVDISAKGLSDDGVLVVTNAVSPKGGTFGIFAVSVPATARFPVTQENTTVVANCTS